MMATVSALQHVFQIPGLLETILSNLDICTLLVSAQRVSKTWHTLISGSQQLQRALFFEPDPHSAKRHNPLLAAIFPFCFHHLRLHDSQDLPFISKCTYLPDLWCGLFPPIDRFRAKREVFSRGDASWKRMLVHQPPIPASHQVMSYRPFAPSNVHEELLFALAPEENEDLRSK
jgi:hypothetical protein